MRGLAIDRALAAVRADLDFKTNGGMMEVTPEHEAGLAATLTILETAKAWYDVMSFANPNTDPVLAGFESALMRAIRGEP